MAGPEAPDLAAAAVEGGADLIELGFPFSDPLADGPVIRAAAEKALAQGMRTAAVHRAASPTSARGSATSPIVPMTYASLLEAYGWERFDADARAAGATGMIIADLPAGAMPGAPARSSSSRRPRPTSASGSPARSTDGWLYLVTVTGTTGARTELSDALGGLAERARRLTDVPLYAGFGISTPEHGGERGRGSPTASSSARGPSRWPRRARPRSRRSSARSGSRSTASDLRRRG